MCISVRNCRCSRTQNRQNTGLSVTSPMKVIATALDRPLYQEGARWQYCPSTRQDRPPCRAAITTWAATAPNQMLSNWVLPWLLQSDSVPVHTPSDQAPVGGLQEFRDFGALILDCPCPLCIVICFSSSHKQRGGRERERPRGRQRRFH